MLAVSERTKRDAIELYGSPPEKITVTPHGVDPAFTPGDGAASASYLLFVGAVQARKDPLAALAAARAVGLPLVVAGPEKEPELARALRDGGADVRGFVEQAELAELYRGAAALVLPSRFEGFGHPGARGDGERHAGRALATTRRCARSRGDAGVYAEDGDLAGRGHSARSPTASGFVAAGPRARAPLLVGARRRALTADVYRKVLGVNVAAVVVSHGHPRELEESLPALGPRSTSSS